MTGENASQVSPEQEASSAPSTPLLRVVSPNATPEEVAALVAVLSAMGGEEAPAPRRTPEWRSPRRKVRRTPMNGPGGWRASSLPH